jgi:hypothetical protein
LSSTPLGSDYFLLYRGFATLTHGYSRLSLSGTEKFFSTKQTCGATSKCTQDVPRCKKTLFLRLSFWYCVFNTRSEEFFLEVDMKIGYPVSMERRTLSHPAFHIKFDDAMEVRNHEYQA